MAAEAVMASAQNQSNNLEKAREGRGGIEVDV